MPRIGSYELHTIDCGRFKLDGGAMFGIVPKPLWERQTPADERNRIPLAMRCLLLAGDDRVILIDNGIGETFTEKFGDIYAVDYSTADLHSGLDDAGCTAEDVTDVILTHLHFDHCGGSTRGTGAEAEVVFPNATYYVQQRQWNWATNPDARDRASFLDDNLAPLQASGQLELLDGPGELFPGIDLLVVEGHTRGQQLVKISDDELTLVFVADLIPTLAHFPELWNMAYDIAPMDTIREKMDFLERAHTNDWQLFFEHDPNTAVVSVTSTDKGYGPARKRSLDHLFSHA